MKIDELNNLDYWTKQEILQNVKQNFVVRTAGGLTIEDHTKHFDLYREIIECIRVNFVELAKIYPITEDMNYGQMAKIILKIRMPKKQVN